MIPSHHKGKFMLEKLAEFHKSDNDSWFKIASINNMLLHDVAIECNTSETVTSFYPTKIVRTNLINQCIYNVKYTNVYLNTIRTCVFNCHSFLFYFFNNNPA